jgi:2,4-dienoyl-CoA reductase (NADPH2)
MMERLFSTTKIGDVVLKNRIVMTAMHLGYTSEGEVNDRLVGFYEERARGGVGLILVGGCTIDDRSAGAYHMIRLDDDRAIAGMAKLAKAVHKHGAQIGAQLFHAGRYARSSMIGGHRPVSASAIPSKITGEVPLEPSLDEIRDVICHFGEAARRAKEAGFDTVEILASAGYLISQFLSPLTNQRKDRYGGGLKERMRFLLEVVEEVRGKVGRKFPIIIRIAGNDFMPGGHTNVEAQEVAVTLEQVGIDAIDVTGGWHETAIPQITMAVPRGGYVYLAQGIRNRVKIPVIACNRINDPVLANRILVQERADLIGMGRALIADPELPNKAEQGRFDEIIYCIGCNQGCFDSVFLERPVTCTMNPSAGREREFTPQPLSGRKKVMVVGAGPAGMEAAWKLSERGHDVHIFEKQKEVGGQLRISSSPPGRKEFLQVIRNLMPQLEKVGVTLHLGTEVDIDTIGKFVPDVLVIATGAEPGFPDIPGIDGEQVITAWDLLEGKKQVVGDVIVLGGGAVGCETALFLASQEMIDAETLYHLVIHRAESNEVLHSLVSRNTRSITLIEQEEKIGQDIGISTRWTILQEIRRLGVKVMVNTKAKRVEKGGVVIERSGKEVFVEGDSVVVAVGSRSVNELWGSLKDKMKEIYLIGDALEPRKVMEAIYEGFSIGLKV